MYSSVYQVILPWQESEHEHYESLAQPCGDSPVTDDGGHNQEDEEQGAEGGATENGSPVIAADRARTFTDETELHCPSHEGNTIQSRACTLHCSAVRVP